MGGLIIQQGRLGSRKIIVCPLQSLVGGRGFAGSDISVPAGLGGALLG
jgi:hypothetical protein